MYDVDQLAKVETPSENKLSRDRKFTCYTWYTKQLPAEDATVIYTNFQAQNPNNEHVEATFRKTCFYSEKAGLNHLILQ